MKRWQRLSSETGCCPSSLGRLHQNAIGWAAYEQQTLLTVLDTGGCTTETPAGLARVRLLAPRQLSSFRLCPCMAGGARGLALWGPFYKDTNPVCEGSTLMIEWPPKGSTSK